MRKYIWPKWNELTDKQKALATNGVGAEWFPAWVRGAITKLSSWFFNEADWNHHDYGYLMGGTEARRSQCDRKFYRAMLRDAWAKGVLLALFGILLATFFYIAVTLMGWASFSYGENKPPEWLRAK